MGAKLALDEMVLNLCQQMIKERVIASGVSVSVRYSKDVTAPTGGSMKMLRATNVYSIIKEYTDKLYQKFTDKNAPIRKLGISFYGIADESSEGFDLFTDENAVQKEKALERTVISIKEKFGKNAMLRGMDLQEDATAKERNKLVGGHNGE